MPGRKYKPKKIDWVADGKKQRVKDTKNRWDSEYSDSQTKVESAHATGYGAKSFIDGGKLKHKKNTGRAGDGVIHGFKKFNDLSAGQKKGLQKHYGYF